ncbi:hypothetical protein HU200_066257 [Digitaria exilis]|uniref:DUF4220 domain-containing protein n=1 Tax=Digitaria exilis TaxID=1010633 RepID=A0A835A1C6_9POAL|nr:hypothetical protein HU200_066257 [Digitaria exilis]
MCLLHILGSLRRRLSHGALHGTVVGVYTLSYPLVGYTIGRMQSSNWYYNDFVVWAVFLLLLLGSTDSLTVCRLDDIDNWKSFYGKQLFKGFLIVSIIVKFGLDMDKVGYLWCPLLAILLVAILKSYVRIASMRMVSKSYLGKNAMVIDEYMQNQDKSVTFNPVTMEGCGYIVAAERCCVKQPGCIPWYEKKDSLTKVTTVDQIWQCTRNLLLIERKDMCLSMALSKMLNRRFAGFELSEAEIEKGHDFVFKGLLVGEEKYWRAFRVIEEELVFVHDMYYTTYSYLYQKGRYLALCLPIIMFSLCLWLTLTCLHVNLQDRNNPSGSGSNPSDRELKTCTIIITVVLAFLELYQFYLYTASGWFKVAVIRHYLNKPFLQQCCCFEMAIDLILRLKAFRPWKDRLGQYCLIRDLGHKSSFKNCLHYSTLCLVDKVMNGRKNSVRLSGNVKRAIVDSLLESNGHLTNGVTSLQNNSVHDRLSWACHVTTSDGAVTRTILVWHIATTLCEHRLDKQGREEDAVKTASTLSQYCMHLLAFAPNLLPDHNSISESILDKSIHEARELLKKAKNKKMESRCEILLNHDGGEEGLVEQGIRLAHQIESIEGPALKKWKVLSDFWAEMMLYVSPSDDARAHLEFLASGGEFITHLWALLTHGGVLKRGPTGP